MWTVAIGAGALAVVMATGTAARETKIDAKAKSGKSVGSSSTSISWPRVMTVRLMMV